MSKPRTLRHLGRLLSRNSFISSSQIRRSAGLSSLIPQGQHAHAHAHASGTMLWGVTGAFGLAATCLFGLPQSTSAADERLEPEALDELAHDLRVGQHADRERAVAMLSGFTLYLEYHEQLLKSDVLSALFACVENPASIPQVRAVALGCCADLMKAKQSHDAVSSSKDFLPAVLQAFQDEEGQLWREGPEEGGIAKAHAARILAELAGDAAMHPLLLRSGAAAALSTSAVETAKQTWQDDATYSSDSAVPGNLQDYHAVECERHTAAALFGLSGTEQGATSLTSAADLAPVKAMAIWGVSHDPILNRYAIGGLARLVASSDGGWKSVAQVGGLQALLSGLRCPDPQAQCFAAGALGSMALRGQEAVQALHSVSAVPALVAMLAPPAKGSKPAPSKEVQQAVRTCALKALQKTSDVPQLLAAIQQAGGHAAIQEALDEGVLNGQGQQAASDILRKFSAG